MLSGPETDILSPNSKQGIIILAESGDGGLFREIDEELRQEHYEKLWKKYGTHIIALAVLLVVGVAGFQGWKSYDLNRQMVAADAFTSAMRLVEGGSLDANKALSDLAEDGTEGYAMLARFHEAALLSKNGKRGEAAALYRALSTQGGLDALYRDMATLLEAALLLDDGLGDELSQRLSGLLANTNPWRHSARELSALAAVSKGDTEGARTLLGALKEDKTAPESLRRRAEELLKGLGA